MSDPKQMAVTMNAVRTNILNDLATKGHTPLDEFDREAFTKEIRPLMEFAAKTQDGDTLPEVWQVRFAIRNSEFRPVYEAVGGFVRKALKIAVGQGGDMAARRPVEALREEYTRDAEPAYQQITGSPVRSDSARANAKRLIAELNKRGPQMTRCESAAQAVVYTRPGETRGDSPLNTIPLELQAEYCAIALAELKATGKGLHPLNVQHTAARLYRGAMAAKEAGAMA